MQTGPAGITSGLPGNVFERLNGNTLKCAIVNGRRSRPVQAAEKDVSRLCLDWASNLENADSARRCRFRNSQQKRASDLDPTYVWIPKLDVTGSKSGLTAPCFHQLDLRPCVGVLFSSGGAFKFEKDAAERPGMKWNGKDRRPCGSMTR